MDYRHKAIANPDARSISDAKMRCLTKCFALFGLGHYIYAGEDLPQGSETSAPKKSAPKKQPKPKTKTVKKSGTDYIAELKVVANELVTKGWVPTGETKTEIKTVVKSDNQDEAKELIKKLKEAGELALKLNDETTEEK